MIIGVKIFYDSFSWPCAVVKKWNQGISLCKLWEGSDVTHESVFFDFWFSRSKAICAFNFILHFISVKIKSDFILQVCMCVPVQPWTVQSPEGKWVLIWTLTPDQSTWNNYTHIHMFIWSCKYRQTLNQFIIITDTHDTHFVRRKFFIAFCFLTKRVICPFKYTNKAPPKPHANLEREREREFVW